MMEKVYELLQEKPIFIPRILLHSYKEFKLTEKELLILAYLLNEGDTLNLTKIQEELGLSKEEILECVSNLQSKDFLSFRVDKVGSKTEEHLDFTELYKKLSFKVVNGKETKKEASKNVFDLFEQEFGRTLTSMEYEIINGWLDGEFQEEMVVLALKEAVYNGVSNLRYIDKILYEWKKKGFQTKEDIEKDKENFQRRKKENKELIDSDWLNE